MARVRGTCRICGENRMLDPHHIISQGHAKKTGQKGLISNPGNVVHICRKCHDQTTASQVRQYLEKKDKGGARKKAKPKAVTCGKCGRSGHNRTACYAKNTADGVAITTDSWVYQKKAKPTNKPTNIWKRKPGRWVKASRLDKNARGMLKAIGKKAEESEGPGVGEYNCCLRCGRQTGIHPGWPLCTFDEWIHGEPIND